MFSRKLEKSDFVGKTIKDVDCRAVNVLKLFFEDGTSIEIDVESFGHGISGMATYAPSAKHKSCCKRGSVPHKD